MLKAAWIQDKDTLKPGQLLISEILTKVNNAKDKTKKIQVLKNNDSSL